MGMRSAIVVRVGYSPHLRTVRRIIERNVPEGEFSVVLNHGGSDLFVGIGGGCDHSQDAAAALSACGYQVRLNFFG